MTAEIVALPGTITLPLDEQKPVAEVVELLERILDQAKSGEIIGVAISTVNKMPNGEASIGSSYRYLVGTRFHLIAAVEWLKHRMMKDLEASP